jgi:outer membrane protein TolC
MRILSVLLVLASTAMAALGQAYSATNSAPTATTNASANVRQLSLEDCVQLALQHNLDLQIDRYNPEISLYALRGAYGAYDPTFSFSGQHDHSEAGSQLLSGGFTVPGSKQDDESFSSSLAGLLPWGTTYSLGLNRLIDTYGNTPTSRPDFSTPIGFSTNFYTEINTLNTVGLRTTNYAQMLGGSTPFESSQGSVGITLTQPLLKNFWIDSSRLTIRISKNRLKYSEVTLRLQLMQTITTLEQAYFDLIYYRENLRVQQKAVELAERLVEENRKKLEVGTLAPLDLQSAEAQAASSRAAVIAAKSQLDTQERLVKSMITDQYSTQWATTGLTPLGDLTAPTPILNLQDSWSKALSQRPELLQAKLDVERAGIQLKYDQNQLLPEVDVFGSYGFNGSGSGNQNELSDALYDIQQMNRPTYTYGGKISLPLSNQRARNAYKADKANMQQLVLALKQLEQNTMILIDNDIGTIRANYQQVLATRDARRYEEAALDAEQKKLDNGKSTTYTVLQVQRDLTTASGNEIQALDTYNKSLSTLSQHEGSTLDRLKIKLEVK